MKLNKGLDDGRMEEINDRVEEEDDEFYGDQDDDNDDNFARQEQFLDGGRGYYDAFGDMTLRETQARDQVLKKIGYLEAYDEAKEWKLQDGFEAGFRETIETSRNIGQTLGKQAATTLFGQLSTPASTTSPAEENSPGEATTNSLEALSIATLKTLADIEEESKGAGVEKTLESMTTLLTELQKCTE